MQNSDLKKDGLYARSRNVIIKAGIDISRLDAIITEDIEIGSEYQYAITDILNHYLIMAAEVNNDPDALEACTKAFIAEMALFFAPEKHARLYAEAYDVVRAVH